jgi:hypothetical protein
MDEMLKGVFLGWLTLTGWALLHIALHMPG